MGVVRCYYLVCVLVAVRFIQGSQLLIEKNIIINKTYKDAYLDYCRQSCFDTDSVPTTDCGNCYCGENCYLYNHCCPDKIKVQNIPGEVLDLSCTATTFPLLKKKTEVNPDNKDFEEHIESFKLITSCHESFSGSQEVVARCKNTDMEEQSIIHPVTDMDTQLSYRNVDCARCNKANNTKKWEMWVICRGNVPTKFGNSVTELFHNFRITEGCSVHFNPRDMENQRKCDLDQKLSNTCDVTGLWKGDGPDLPQKCLHEKTVNDYSNVFCYSCTQNASYPDYSSRIQDIVGVIDDERTQLQPVNYSVVDTHKRVCRPVLCPDGRLMVNGTCRSLFRRFNGYMYKICMKYKVSAKISQLEEIEIFTTSDFSRNFKGKVGKILSTNGMATLNYTKSILSMTPCVDGYLNSTMTIEFYFSSTNSLTSEDTNIRHIQDKLKMLVGSDELMPFEVLSVEQTPNCFRTEMDAQGRGGPCLPYSADRPSHAYRIIWALNYLFSAKRVYVSNLLMCPQMVLNQAEVDYDSDIDMITILANNRTLKGTEFQLVDPGYLICVEDYIENAEIVQTQICTAQPPSRYVESRAVDLDRSIFSSLLIYVMTLFIF